MANVARAFELKTISIASGTSMASNVLDMTGYGQMAIHLPAAWSSTASIGFYASSTSGGAYLPVYDDQGTLVQIDGCLASRIYVAPPQVGALHYVKLWSQDGTATSVPQGATRSLIVEMKS